MRTLRHAIVCTVLVSLVSACHTGLPLEVLHAVPTGELQTSPMWIEVRFDRAIVDPDATDPLAKGLDVRVDPPLAGEIGFPTPNSMTYTFADRVPVATHFTITVASGLRSADGKAVLKSDYSFEFSSERNRGDRLYQIEETSDASEDFPEDGGRSVRNLGLNDSLLLTLQRPEKVARLKELISIQGTAMAGGNTRRLDARLAFPADDIADRVLISPAGNWPKHTRLHVTIGAGLGIAEEGAGPLTSKEDQVLSGATYGPIKVVRGPECEMCRPPSTLLLEFSTPVECEDVLPHVRLKPAPDDLRCAGQVSPTVVRIEPLPALSAYTKYKIIVRPGVVDKFGQELNAKAKFDIETGDANPRFAHQLMFNVLERKLGAVHEEKVYKTPVLKVEAARLPFSEAWKIIASQGLGDQVAWSQLPWWLSDDYYYDYDYDCTWDDELGEEVCGTGNSRRRHPGATDNADISIPNAKTTIIDVDDADDWSVVQVSLDPYLDGKGGVVVIKSTPQSKNGNRLSNPVLRLLNVTDIGLSAKYSPSQLIVLATRLSDGKAIEGAKIAIYTVSAKNPQELGEAATTGTTNANGVVVFSSSEVSRSGEEPNLQKRGLFITATIDDDEAFVWSKFESGGRRASSTGPGLVGKIYTERGVYKPGETVYYRAVARKQVAQGFATPHGVVEVIAKRGAYWYYDEDEDEIYRKKTELSEYGTVSGSFEVPDDASIGDYGLALRMDDQRLTGTFKVAEFRRAEMKVTVNTDKTEYIRGQKMDVRVNADYLFGAPAAGLDLRWSLRRTWGYFASKRFPSARFSDYDYHSWYDEQSSYSEFVDEGTATLDDNGAFSMQTRLKKAGGRGKIENLVVSATVDDESGQSVSSRRTVRVHPASFHVGLMPHGYLKEKDKLFTFEAVAVTPKDKAVGGVELKVHSHQEYWYSVKRKGPGGRMYWDYRREVIDERNICTGTTNSQGKITCQFTPRKGGSMKLRVVAKDKKGRRVRASTWFWVTGDPDYYGGRSDRGNQVGLMSEAPEVEVGSTARIAITSPFREAMALITVEREDILWRKVMKIGSNGMVDIPIANSWAPNVYISATVVRGRITPGGKMKPDPERDKPAYALGYLNLKVKPTGNTLIVDIEIDKKRYEPGDKITATVTTKTAKGHPANTEVNLYAVDEGVLMLTAYKTPNLIPAMFRERPYAVLALDTRMHVLGRRQFITPVIKGEEDGGGGGGDEGDGEELRKDFNPVATWIGALTTGASGSATHTFEVPDTLTTYRVMAVAVSTSDKFGSGETEFTVSKTLMMRQSMPRFARPADRMQAGVVINQLSGKAGDVTVEIETIDETLFKVHGKRKLSKKVGAKQTVAFRFDLEAMDVDGESEIIFSARMGKFRDRVQLILPVRRLQPRESISVAGVLEPGAVTHTLNMPKGARVTGLEINMSGLPVASLEQKIRHLVGYPYGCLEQRTSKIMPLIAIRELSEQLGFASVPTEKIKGWVKEWVKLVPKYRCRDDGFDYYPGCRSGSDPYLTAFALDGLLTARKYGYNVPEAIIDPAATYLENKLANMGSGKSWDHNTSGMAGALRVLATLGRSKPAFETVLYEGRTNLPLFAKTDLTRAVFARTGTRNAMVDTLLKDVLSGAKKSNGVIKFTADDPDRYWWAWDSDLRSTAMVLRTLLEVEPTDARVPLIVRGLIELDDAESYHSTQGVTQTLLALAEAAERIKTLGQKPVATVKIGSKTVMRGKKIGTKVEQTKMKPADIGDSPFELAIENTGNGPLYFGSFLHYAFPATARLPAKSEGFRVERQYFDRAGNAIGETVRVGDYVEVQIKLWVDDDGRMVVVDDPLPAGLEPIDTTLATSDTEMAAVMKGRSGDWSWWRSRYKEMRDDRTEWHFRRLWRSYRNRAIKLRYLTRAVTAGTYYAPGTSVERMYQPHIRGRGLGRELKILPKE